MAKVFDEGVLIGRCRCEDHAKDIEKFSFVRENRGKVFYISPDDVPQELLCTTCLRKGCIKHGGLIISEAAYNQGLAILGPYPGLQLTDRQKANAKQAWPK
jgi:hypothetical protein